MVKQYHLSSMVVTRVNTVENRLCLYTSWPYKNQSGGGGGKEETLHYYTDGQQANAPVGTTTSVTQQGCVFVCLVLMHFQDHHHGTIINFSNIHVAALLHGARLG